MTLDALWRRAVRAAGGRPFLTFDDLEGSVSAWTYAEFDALVDRVAAGLASHGVGPARPVHVALANSPAFVAIWLAAVRLGATLVPSDPQASARELAEHAARTGPAVGVCAAARAATYRELVEGPVILEVDERDPELAALLGDPAAAARPRPLPGDPAAVMFTSGTTAAPKGVVVTQANYAFAGEVMAAAAALRPDDRCLVVLPLFHANAQYYSIAPAIATGASVALMGRFSASGFAEQGRRHRATHASLFAAPIRMILARTPDDAEPVGLRHCWFAQDLADDGYDAFARLAGCRPRQLYGMTETIPAVLSNPAVEPLPASLGLPTVGCEVRLRVPDGDDEPAPGEAGEITVAGRRGRELFAGYLDDEATTAASFRSGEFRTGDLATRAEEGRFAFAGRRGDVLKVSGENVSIVEVEAVLAEHPGVLDCAVVGMADDLRDEVPVGHVVRDERHPSLSETELLAWCGERLAPAKRPRRIDFHAELPRTSVGKVKRFVLRDQVTPRA